MVWRKLETLFKMEEVRLKRLHSMWFPKMPRLVKSVDKDRRVVAAGTQRVAVCGGGGGGVTAYLSPFSVVITDTQNQMIKESLFNHSSGG